MPFPTAAYDTSLFYALVGPLIGQIVTLAFLIPVALMLRALVLEKEERLREQLLTQGTRNAAYFASSVARPL